MHATIARPQRRKLHVAVCLALSASAGPACAEVFEVTSAADAGTGSLRAAVAEANSSVGTDNIEFSMDLSTITLETGEIEITDDLKIIGPESRQVISGNSSTRIFNVSGAQYLELQNLELVDGRTNLDRSSIPCSEADGRGAAICANGVHLELRNVIARNNETTGAFAHGGAIRAEQVTVYGSAFDSNVAIDGRGGAIYAVGDLLLVDSVVTGNLSGQDGGGIYAGAAEGSVSITNSVIDSNTAEGIGGGLRTTSNLDIGQSTISRNTSLFSGGALFLRYGSGVISNSTVSGNYVDVTFYYAGAGGAIKASDANLEIHNSTITGNSASSGAGGISSSSDSGGAQTLFLDSSVLAGNGGSAGNFVSTAGADGSVTLNSTFSIFGDVSSEINGTSEANLFNDDPMLKSLADNGCGTLAGIGQFEQCVSAHLPIDGSPVIGHGRNTAGLETDQRGAGFPRVLAGSTDIGSIEFPASLLRLDPDPLAFGNVATGAVAGPLPVTIKNSGTSALEIVTIGTASTPFATGTTTCPAVPFPLEAGDSCTLEIEFAPESPGEFNQIIPVESDGAAGSDTRIVLSGTSGQFDVAVMKTNAAEFVLPGVATIYNIQVLNLGLSDLFGVEVVDILPPELDVTAATWTCTPGSGATCSADSGTGDIDELVDLPAGSGLEFTLVAPVIADEGVDVGNTVTATLPPGIDDEDPSNNTATDTDPVAIFASDFEFAGCTEDLIENRFCVTAENVVLDIVTGLEWRRCAVGRTWDEASQSCVGDPDTIDWAAASAAADGWRLPTVAELSALRFCSDGDPATFLPSVSAPGIRCENPGAITQPVIEATAFPNMLLNAPSGAPSFWTAADGDDTIEDSSLAVSFVDGSILNVPVTHEIRVLLVRD